MSVVLAVLLLLVVLPVSTVLLAAHPVGELAAGGGSSRLGAFWDKPVHFIETGLANGTRWAVDLSGTTHSSTTKTIKFTWIVGVFPFTVRPVVGYTASPSSGNVTVGNRGATVNITFTPISAAYTVTFVENGLYPGSPWSVNLNGTNASATTTSIRFSVPNGTYNFTTTPIVAGPPGVEFYSNLTSGSVVVNGTNVTVDVPYLVHFFLTMGVTPAGAGTVSPNSLWFSAGAVVSLSELPASGFAFFNWSGVGNGSYSGTNATPRITMNGPITEIATFGAGYAVDFEEVGLLDGVTWSVTFNGVTESAFLVFLDFAAPNGTYPYAVAPIPGYHADSYRGNVTVNGTAVTVIIHWVRLTYSVTFVESGLISGTSWSVTLNGSSQSATASAIGFSESNGSFPYTIAAVPGYTSNVSSGTVVVSGAAVTVDVGFTASGPVPRSYSITFSETGLPAGSNWSVTLNGSGASPAFTTSTEVTLTGIANGTYHYWVPDVGGFHATNRTGTVPVIGHNLTVAIVFAGLGPAVTHTPGPQVTVEEIVVFALIAAAVIIAVYLVYRRE